MKNRDAKIPTRLVAPKIKAWAAKYETTSIRGQNRPLVANSADSWSNEGGIRAISPITVIASRMKVDPSAINKIVNEFYENVEFNKVDKIFCAMDYGLFGWLDGGELEKHYWNADISNEAWTYNGKDAKVCEEIDCENMFEKTKSTKKYCSDTCRHRATRRNPEVRERRNRLAREKYREKNNVPKARHRV